MKATAIDACSPSDMNQRSVSPTELFLQSSRPGENGGQRIPAPTGAEWSWLHSFQEANRHKDEFLAMLAHELRNPLAPINNAIQILRIKGRADSELEEVTDMVDHQVQHLTRLVDDLLDVVRISQGKINLQMEPLDLNTVVKRAIEISRPGIDARKHDLRVSLPGQAIEVEGDSLRLVQVVANLLNNSAKYSEDGGRIDLELEAIGGQAVLRVRDTGIGIEPAMLPTIFDLFTQMKGSLGLAGEGLGIGLALARNTIEAHGGGVQAASAGLGQGSEFVVRLPLLRKTPALALAPPERPWEVVDPTSRRILLIDDNMDLADSMAMLLRFAGHEVRTAYDGRTGVALARVQSPEVVICDITMSDMSGLEVACHLREDLGLHDALLVAMSGYGRDEDKHLSQEAGFNAHLVKPVQLSNLKAILASFDSRRPGSPVPYKTRTPVP